MVRRPVLGIALLVCLIAALPAAGADQTVGLFLNTDEAYDGYTLFGPNFGTAVYLLRNDGHVVHRWDTPYQPGLMGYLREDGHLIRAARSTDGENAPPGFGGHYEEYDWEGNLVWQWYPDYEQMLPHHDIEIMPNGNLLVTMWEYKTQEEVIAAGRNPLNAGEFWPDSILELRPIPPNDAEIVWEWHVWDHLVQELDPTKPNFGVVADHPELIDINYGEPALSWNHVNSVDYNPELDQIMLSSRTFNEIWVIDHSTTTEEAAGHTGGTHGRGGDLLYRWGNPLAYHRGSPFDQKLRAQHDAQWIPPGHPGEGNILIFNNGYLETFEQSSVDEIVPPVDESGVYPQLFGDAPFLPLEPTWSYSAARFFSAFISGTERMPNGNTLIISGLPGQIFEVTPDKEVVWDYVNPISGAGTAAQGDPIAQNFVFKARRYPVDHPAFDGRELTPQGPIESFLEPTALPNDSMVAKKLIKGGGWIEVAWDAAGCSSHDYKLLWGALDDVANYELRKGACSTGLGGSYVWSTVPEGSIYFLLVGTDDSGVYESSFGHDSAGRERSPHAASFACGGTTKILSATCESGGAPGR
jgi:hypothetical protein